MPLPPGATLVSDAAPEMKLPPGATLVNSGTQAPPQSNLDRWRAESTSDRWTDLPGALAATGEAVKGAAKYAGQAALGTFGAIQNLTSPFPTFGSPIEQMAETKLMTPQNPEQNAGYKGAAIASTVLPLVKPGLALASRALLLGRTPEGAYLSALKASTTLSEAERAQLAKTAIEEKIPVTREGLDMLNQRISDVNQAIKNEIAANPNRPINKFAVANRLNKTAEIFSDQPAPGSDLQSISDIGNEFLRNPRGEMQPGVMSAEGAQKMKQGTYRILAGKYGEQGSAAVEAQKALARGLKEEIANQFPELAKLNARDSKLLDLQPVLERAVSRIGNHQLIGIGTPVTAAAGKAVTGSNQAGAALGLMKAVLDNPSVKSQLAISLAKAGLSPAAAFSRIQAYSGLLAAAAVRQATGTSGSDEAADSGDTPNQ